MDSTGGLGVGPGTAAPLLWELSLGVPLHFLKAKRWYYASTIAMSTLSTLILSVRLSGEKWTAPKRRWRVSRIRRNVGSGDTTVFTDHRPTIENSCDDRDLQSCQIDRQPAD